ncbi:MAG: tetratricopeptide repeat protein [Planctomycetota bacterium]
MQLRKEQVLALLTLVFGAYVARGYFAAPPTFRRYAPKAAEYEAKPVGAPLLVASEASAQKRRDPFTEPSETRPLPPRPLDFPPHAPLSFAALPLDPGPDLRHAFGLRVDGAPVAGVTLSFGGDAAAAAGGGEAPGETAAATPTRAELEARAALTYDRVYYGGLASPYFGTIEADGQDVFALEERTDFSGVTLRLRRYDLTRQRLAETLALGGDQLRIDRVVLADTLRNQISRRERKVPDLPSHLPERRALVDWLLERAREHAWVYEKAYHHAMRYRELSKGDLDGLRLMQRVLRAQGDLAGELALLEQLPLTGSEGAFRFEGLGVLKARLGLWRDAEDDLRAAVRLQPTDARPHAALAEFLRLRGRSREAVAAAARAEQAIGSVQDPTARARIGRVLVSCRLAVLDVVGARAALPMAQGSDGPAHYLEGCIHYAAGDANAALLSFRSVTVAQDLGAAAIGQAAALARLGKLQEAVDLCLRVFDQDPLLRHRAATGVAWACLRAGQPETALGWIDRALEADPTDSFALYLRGRALRLSGQLAAAEEATAAALRLRDDFVHAVAEMAEAQAARAGESVGEEQAKAAVAARRYADRAVALAVTPSPELFELQGMRAFSAADPRGAAAAFESGRDAVASEAEKAFGKGALAVVAYSRGAFEDATIALQRLTQDLGKEDPIAKWASTTLDAIDDHAQKETLGDSFDRADVGTVWAVDADGPLGAALVDGRLAFRGRFSRSGQGQVWAERVGAIKKGRNFLAVAATMQTGPAQPAARGFVGIGIEVPRGNQGSDVLVRLGVREGKPFLRIEDGRANGEPLVEQKAIEVAGFAPGALQQLELRVVPRGEPSSRQFALVASWNGVVVHRRDMQSLSGSTNSELKTVLFALGDKGDDVDVAFDDWRLERRKER